MSFFIQSGSHLNHYKTLSIQHDTIHIRSTPNQGICVLGMGSLQQYSRGPLLYICHILMCFNVYNSTRWKVIWGHQPSGHNQGNWPWVHLHARSPTMITIYIRLYPYCDGHWRHICNHSVIHATYRIMHSEVELYIKKAHWAFDIYSDD